MFGGVSPQCLGELVKKSVLRLISSHVVSSVFTSDCEREGTESGPVFAHSCVPTKILMERNYNNYVCVTPYTLELTEPILLEFRIEIELYNF